MENVIAQHITKTPGVCGGRPCIAGHRIRVQDIVVLHDNHGLSPKEILSEYPGITLADVHAALAYYYGHQDEIKEEFRKAEEMYEWVKKNIPSRIPPELRKKIDGWSIKFFFDQLNALLLLHGVLTTDEMRNQVEYL